jgi:hypothetical protein
MVSIEFLVSQGCLKAVFHTSFKNCSKNDPSLAKSVNRCRLILIQINRTNYGHENIEQYLRHSRQPSQKPFFYKGRDLNQKNYRVYRLLYS